MVKPLLYETELVAALYQQFRRANSFVIGMALISRNGLHALIQDMTNCLLRGGKGSVLFGVDLPTNPDAISELVQLRDKFAGQFRLRRFESGKQSTFHPKLFIFVGQNGDRSAIVGSANLTNSGLTANIEAGILVDDIRSTAKLHDYLDEIYEGGHAKEVDAEWLADYRKLWREREKLQQQVDRVRSKASRLRASKNETARIPSRIKGSRFLFTGRLTEFSREKLHKLVEKFGGRALKGEGSAGTVDCLVSGKLSGGRKTTRKQRAARACGTPVIHAEQFLAILQREKRRRGIR